MENPVVFREAHRLVLELVSQGRVAGLRLDHTDGLYDPEAYFATLRDALQGALPAPAGRPPEYVVAEKILERGEEMPRTWAVAGTTGYDFLATVNGLWVDPRSRQQFDELLTRFAGVTEDYAEIVYRSKRVILKNAVSSEVQMLAHLLKRIADGKRHARDFTLTSLRRAITETIEAFPVYRTYVRPDGSRQPHDEAHVRRAIGTAARANPLLDPSVFEFLRSMLLLEELTDDNVRFAMRFQQLTGPVMAKGVEDTATYRYVRLMSCNEVGCDPAIFGHGPEQLHDQNIATLARWPLSMTALTTHDTKLSEDVRARLAVLSEIPDQWKRIVQELSARAGHHVSGPPDESSPSHLDQYVFFQIATGAFPFEGLPDDDARRRFSHRMAAYMGKAAHEAKLRTSWVAPNAAYDDAVQKFVQGALGDPEFLAALAGFAESIMASGACNSLAQRCLALASPGVPDVYQGTELWDLSLVDPDNRRPVDFGRRRSMLEQLDATGAPTVDFARDSGLDLPRWSHQAASASHGSAHAAGAAATVLRGQLPGPRAVLGAPGGLRAQAR